MDPNASTAPVAFSVRFSKGEATPTPQVRVDVFEVGGIIPQRGLVPSGSGFSGQVIDAEAIGVYFWAGTESSFQDLRVIRRRLMVSISNACGVAIFPGLIANFDFRGTVFDFDELAVMPLPSYCKQDQ